MNALFRVQPDETLLLLFRHGEHVDQVLTPSAIRALRQIIQALIQWVTRLCAAYSSPQPRCRMTCSIILEAFGQVDIPIIPVAQLDDLSIEADVDREAIRRAAAAANMEPEAYALTAPELDSVILRRGSEGVAAFRRLARNHRGGVVLVSTHGSTRIEPTLLTLLGDNTLAMRTAAVEGRHSVIRHVEYGQLILVRIHQSGTTHIHYIKGDDLK